MLVIDLFFASYCSDLQHVIDLDKKLNIFLTNIHAKCEGKQVLKGVKKEAWSE